MINALSDLGMDLDKPLHNGQATWLHVAAHQGSADAVQALIAAVAHVHTQMPREVVVQLLSHCFHSVIHLEPDQFHTRAAIALL